MQPLTVQIGRTQAGEPVTVDLREHLWCGGSVGSGKSTLLVRLAISAATTWSPADLQLLLAEASHGVCFDQVARLPHTTAYAPSTETRDDRLFAAMIDDEISRRTALAEMGLLAREPHLVVLADQPQLSAAGVPALGESLARLVAAGGDLRISVVITSRSVDESSVFGALRQLIQARISLKFFTETGETRTLGMPEPVPPLESTPGRAYLRRGPEPVIVPFHMDDVTAADVREALFRAKTAGIRAKPLWPPLPMFVYDELRFIEDEERGRATGIPVGLVRTPENVLARLDFAHHPHLIILGAPRTGRSTALRVILRGIAHHYTATECAVLLLQDIQLDGVLPAQHVIASSNSADVPTEILDDVVASLRKRVDNQHGWQGPRLFVVIDDYDKFNEEALSPIWKFIPHAKHIHLNFIIAGTSAITERPHVAALRATKLTLDDTPGQATLRRHPDNETRIKLPWSQQT